MTLEKIRLAQHYGKRPYIAEGRWCEAGFYTFISVQCPQPDLLADLQRLKDKYGGNVSRLDLAFEAYADPQMSVDQQADLLQRTLFLRNRPRGPIKQHENDGAPANAGHNYVLNAHLKRTSRDVAMYRDRNSKLDPTILRVARFEPRLRGRETFGRPYRDHDASLPIIEEPAEIITCNIGALARRHIKFMDHDDRKFRKRLFAGKTSEQIADIKRRWRHEAHQFQFGQRVHDYDEHLPMWNVDTLVALPSAITWGAVRRADKKSSKDDE